MKVTHYAVYLDDQPEHTMPVGLFRRTDEGGDEAFTRAGQWEPTRHWQGEDKGKRLLEIDTMEAAILEEHFRMLIENRPPDGETCKDHEH